MLAVYGLASSGEKYFPDDKGVLIINISEHFVDVGSINEHVVLH